eukprot:CAMPEP_0184667842 /NCGR_PEP_ID=MMETSP0308-20130426/69425_1 /TAXON_ID=38269 /ORGANISM="Gloeochaete witrockiana, Strain SAG 46.84" /LENGTH=35 /DNA_ID= /DNA_START= /DNA_END= /DNA_ORIENTATION=
MVRTRVGFGLGLGKVHHIDSPALKSEDGIENEQTN